MSTSLTSRIGAAARALITAAGMTTAVAATDIKSAAEALNRQYAEYSKVDISTRIAAEIKKTHRPGISGSV